MSKFPVQGTHNMLTRNKKKRMAGKDKSSPESSTQKHSAVPDNNAVEVPGKTVTMHHGGTSGDPDVDCRRTDYLQVAWLLREKLNDLVDSDNGEIPELGLRSLLDMAASHNIVSVDPTMLNPILWRTLPKELLHLVLARLPVPDIIRLRSLSREWRRDMATLNSGINQACEEASPGTMVALVSHCATDAFFVIICDVTKGSCLYTYHLRLRRPKNDDSEHWPHTWTAVDACDGGLVCFISLWKPMNDNRLAIVVVNLLTGVQHELPPLHYQYTTLPKVVQIKVDLDTKRYTVVVGTNRAKASCLTIERYDSKTKKWTVLEKWTVAVPPWGSLFGPVYNWDRRVGAKYYTLSRLKTQGAYDFREGKLEFYKDFNPLTQDSLLMDMALEKNRMFALLEQTQEDASLPRWFCITEYHFENEKKAWVKGKSYECPCFEDLVVKDLSTVRLFACDSFLMVIFHHGENNSYFRLLDLSTSEWSEWSEWSNLPQDSEEFYTLEAVLCKAFWNVIP